jgi:hypothetical protein
MPQHYRSADPRGLRAAQHRARASRSLPDTSSGSRVTSTRADKAIGGGGRLEFGRFRDVVDQTARVAGWSFVYEVP